MIKFAVVSDIHLGHRRNSASSIVKALNVAFPGDAETAQLDAIFLAGDVFDRLIDLPNEDVVVIQLWVARLIRLCSEFNIKLRVLEGTRSHDWGQSGIFTTVAEQLALPIDLQYIRTLHIEYMADFGLNILYMPDDLPHGAAHTLEQAKELLKSKGLAYADLAIMHGSFEYQLPEVARSPATHSSAEWLQIVRGPLFIGHVHIPSSYDRIHAQGSFDRLTHNEEHPKGHLRCELESDGTYRVKFVENKLARIYRDVIVGEDELLSDLIERLKFIEKLPPDSCVRITAPKGHVALSDMSVFIRLYPTITWSEKVVDKEVEKFEAEVVEHKELMYTPIHIDRDNVEELMMQRIVKLTQDTRIIDSARANLKELKAI